MTDVLRRDGDATRLRIIEAAKAELNQFGASGFRLKRVAANADVSISLISSKFNDRDGLVAIAAAADFIIMLEHAFAPFIDALGAVDSADDLRCAIEVMIEGSLSPDGIDGRVRRLEALSIAIHDEVARETIGSALEALDHRATAALQSSLERGFIAPGVTPGSFFWVWQALQFGSPATMFSHEPLVTAGEWRDAARAIATSLTQ